MESAVVDSRFYGGADMARIGHGFARPVPAG
jgi:hypothetical protein